MRLKITFMKKVCLICSVVIITLLQMNCSKKSNTTNNVNSTDIPKLTTSALDSIKFTSAVSGGNITSSGSSLITGRGVCWSTSPNPTIPGSYTSDGTGTGSFTSKITGLVAGTTYYVRAYATNGNGTGYGNQDTLTTISNIPTIRTDSVS